MLYAVDTYAHVQHIKARVVNAVKEVPWDISYTTQHQDVQIATTSRNAQPSSRLLNATEIPTDQSGKTASGELYPMLPTRES